MKTLSRSTFAILTSNFENTDMLAKEELMGIGAAGWKKQVTLQNQ